jgi:hypothetical protein
MQVTSMIDPVRVGIPTPDSENRIFEITSEQDSTSGRWGAEIREEIDRAPFPKSYVRWDSPSESSGDPILFDTPAEAIGDAVTRIVDSVMG